MKKSVGILISVLSILVIIAAVFIYLMVDKVNTEKKVDNLAKSIVEDVLTDDELDYLTKNKYIDAKEVVIITKIKNEVVASDWSNQSIDKLKEDRKQLDDINDAIKTKITKNIKDQVVTLTNKLNNLKPLTNQEKTSKDQYLAQINESIDDKSISDLIKAERKILEYSKKITTLADDIQASELKSLLKEVPQYLSREAILKHGIEVVNFNFTGLDTVGETFYPKACQLSDKFELNSYENIERIAKETGADLANEPKVNQKVNEYQHKKFYMTYFNTKFNKITTLTDETTNKVYLIYSGSFKFSCEKNSGGGAAIIIAYDYQTKKIVSVVGTQSNTSFIIDGDPIGFFISNGKTYYKDMN